MRKLLSPYLHFTWSVTYCPQGCTIARLSLSPQLQTIGKALLANYASNNSPVVGRSRLVEMQRGSSFPFANGRLRRHRLRNFYREMWNCPITQKRRFWKKFSSFRKGPRQQPDRIYIYIYIYICKRQTNRKDGRTVHANQQRECND